MKRGGSLLSAAAVLGVAATVGVSTMKPKPPAEAPATQRTAPALDAQAAQSFANGPCPDLEKRLQGFFLVDENEVAAPDSCFPALKQRPINSPNLQAQANHQPLDIATLPDPQHTHITNNFDRTGEVKKHAGQDENYKCYSP